MEYRNQLCETFKSTEDMIHQIEDDIENRDDVSENTRDIWKEMLKDLRHLRTSIEVALWSVYDFDVYTDLS